MLNPAPVFRFLADAAQDGPTALATITAVEGTSTRNPGTHMGIAANGRWVGSFSGGCVEAAVAAEALLAIKQGKPRQFRLGAGSPFIDIRLPCGGAMEIVIHPLTDGALARAVLEGFAARQPLHLRLPKDGAPALAAEAGDGIVTHLPPLRLVVAGQGDSVAALHRLASAFGAELCVLTPDVALADALEGEGCSAFRLLTQGAPCPQLQLDLWSAAIFYFHDHDWEAALIAQALSQPSFYVGAMGSLRTHQMRCEALKALGVSSEAIESIRAPIGLLRASRDPEMLALSTLAEVAQAYGALSR